MLHRMTLAASAIGIVVAAAAGVTVQPGHAQQQQQQAAAKGQANECLAKPTGAPPRGSHWYYRIDRQTRRRCWYLGPEKARVRKSAATEQATSPVPTPRPSEAPSGAPTPVETPAIAAADASRADAANPDANGIDAGAASAATFPTAWPPAADTAGSSEVSDAAPTTATPTTATSATATAGNEETGGAAAPAAQDEMVWPVLTAAERAAAAQSAEAAPGLGSLVIFLAAAAAFVAIAFRATLKLWSAWFGPRDPLANIRITPAIRPRAQSRSMFDRTDMDREAEMFRPRDIAARWTPATETTSRWDAVARFPRRPGAPGHELRDHDETPEHENDAPAARRRAVA